MKIKQSKADAVVRGFMLHVYKQSLFQRLRFCWVVMSRKGYRS